MENPMRERIQQRLDELGISAIEAARRVPSLNRYFIYDFMTGKKASIPTKRVGEVAKALSCSPSFLLTGSAAPSLPPMKLLELSAVIEPDKWRKEQPDFSEEIHVGTDPAYPAEEQEAFVCRTDDFEKIGIPNGAVVLVATRAKIERGKIVVTRHSRESADGDGIEQMYTLRKIDSNHQLAALMAEHSKKVGVVIQAVKIF